MKKKRMALPGAQKRLPLPNVFERRSSTGIGIFAKISGQIVFLLYE